MPEYTYDEERYRELVPVSGRGIPTGAAQGRKGIAADFAAFDHGNTLIEQGDEQANEFGLRLTAQAQKDHVVLREDRVHHFRDDALVVADDAWEERLVVTELGQQIPPHFVFDRFAALKTELFDFVECCHAWTVIIARPPLQTVVPSPQLDSGATPRRHHGAHGI